MKILKKITVCLSLIIVVLAGTLWILSHTISPETVKNLVTQQLEAITHKKVLIKGKMSWQILPRPGLKIADMTLGETNVNNDYQALIKSLRFNLKLSPLFKGHLIFSEIDMDGLDLKIDLNQLSATDSPPQNTAKSQVNLGVTSFAIEQFILNHGQITLTNTNKKTYSIHDVKFSLEQLNFSNTPFPLQIKGYIESLNKTQPLSSLVSFKGRLTLDPQLLSNPTHLLSHLKLNGQLLMQNNHFYNLSLDKITGNLRSTSTQLIINPLTLYLYKGESIGELHYNYKKQTLALSQTATNLNGGQLFLDLLNQKLIKGTLDYALSMEFPVNQPLLTNLSGKGTISLKEGKLLTVDLNELLQVSNDKLFSLLDVQKNLKTEQLRLSDAEMNQYSQGNTPFQLATVKLSAQEGNLKVESLLMQAPRFDITGDGLVNLDTLAVNSRLQTHLNKGVPDFPIIKQAFGGDFPIVIKGYLNKPVILPDLSLINPIITRMLLDKTLGKPMQILGEQIKAIIH